MDTLHQLTKTHQCTKVLNYQTINFVGSRCDFNTLQLFATCCCNFQNFKLLMNISEENSPCGQHSCVWWETQSPNWPEEPTKWAAACELSSRPPDASSQLPVKICRKKKVLWRLFSLFKKRAAGSGEARSCLSETFGLRDQLQFSGPGRSGSGAG